MYVAFTSFSLIHLLLEGGIFGNDGRPFGYGGLWSMKRGDVALVRPGLLECSFSFAKLFVWLGYFLSASRGLRCFVTAQLKVQRLKYDGLAAQAPIGSNRNSIAEPNGRG